ncbi:MAG: hypothetical protein WCK76_00285 [Elusimicrobiota bacterium]
MNNNGTSAERACCRCVHRAAALRGALWTIPIWAATLESAAAAASPRFDAYTLTWPDYFGTALYMLFLFGSSLCLLTAFWLTSRPAGFADAAKQGLSSALAAAAAYLVFAFAAQFNLDPKGPAWGGAFGLLSALGTLLAALLGAFAKLGYRYFTGNVLNPYKAPPAGPK